MNRSAEQGDGTTNQDKYQQFRRSRHICNLPYLCDWPANRQPARTGCIFGSHGLVVGAFQVYQRSSIRDLARSRKKTLE